MADNEDKDEIETTYSGEAGRRERSTPSRAPRELGLDPEEVRGQRIIGDQDPGFGDTSYGARDGERRNPELTPDVEKLGTGGISTSGGRAGGARGHAGSSDEGAGGDDAA
jgi:hypothetical protein